MRHITDAEMIAGYILTVLAISICVGLAWVVVYPLIVLMMAI